MKNTVKTELTADSHIIKLFAHDVYYKNHVIIGTDEAGRGPAAGGVFASAVCFSKRSRELVEKLSILNDSKQLSKKKRELLYEIIKENSINSTVCIEVEEIEKINILNASLKAMKLAVENVLEIAAKETGLNYKSFFVLVDGNKRIKNFDLCSQKWVVKGDSQSASIAAASILAKVSRDRYMEELDREFPEYGWANNAGYLTKEHIQAIDKYGMCKYHRPSFLKKHFAKQEQLSLF